MKTNELKFVQKTGTMFVQNIQKQSEKFVKNKETNKKIKNTRLKTKNSDD